MPAGTHIKANASKNRNVRYARAQQLELQLEEDVRDLMDRAEQADHRHDDHGQSIPEDMARRESLKKKIQAARQHLENKAKDRALAEQAEYEEKVRRRENRENKGREIHPPKETPDDHEQANLTHPWGVLRAAPVAPDSLPHYKELPQPDHQTTRVHQFNGSA